MINKKVLVISIALFPVFLFARLIGVFIVLWDECYQTTLSEWRNK